jgi:hypothetical protein
MKRIRLITNCKKNDNVGGTKLEGKKSRIKALLIIIKFICEASYRDGDDDDNENKRTLIFSG